MTASTGVVTSTGDRITLGVHGRSLHLVDLENLLGDPRARGPEVVATLDRYREIAGWREGDLVYVAANPALALVVGVEWGETCALRAARGADGADLALLAQCAPEFVAARVERLVVGSGDGIFADRARAVRSRGVPVVVVSRPDALSGALEGQGFEIRQFTPPSAPVSVAA